MVWMPPRVWVAGETVTDAQLNQHVRDNLLVVDPTVDWTVLPLENGWSNYGAGWHPARYMMRANVVHVQGLIQGGGLGAGLSIGTLDAGHRPAYQLLRGSIHSDGVGVYFNRMDILPDGKIYVMTALSGNDWLLINFVFTRG